MQAFDDLGKLGRPNRDAWLRRYANPPEALALAQQALQQARQQRDMLAQARAWHTMGATRILLHDLETALEDLQQAEDLYAGFDVPGCAAELRANVATVYMYLGQFDLSLEWHYEALNAARALQLFFVEAEVLTNIGVIYTRLNRFEEAKVFLDDALGLKDRIEDGYPIIRTLTALGELFFQMGRLQTAMEYQQEALSHAKAVGMAHAMGDPLLNLALIRLERAELEVAGQILDRALQNYEQHGNKRGIVLCYLNACRLHTHTHQPDKAIEKGEEALYRATELNNLPLMANAHRFLAEAHKKAGTLETALYHLEQFAQLKSDALRESAQQTFRSLQRHHQLQDAEREKELYRLRNIQLNQDNTRLDTERARFEEALTTLNSSILYASRIQRALLPVDELFQKHFQDSFVLFLPRDGVSGDFYFLQSAQNGRILLGAADCTGHGVPGSLLGMLGFSILQLIIGEQGYSRPDKVLKLLDLYISDVLSRQGRDRDIKDGMDVALVNLDPETRQIEFSGAFNSAFIVRNAELHLLKATRMAVGGNFDGKIKAFDLHRFDAQPGDCLYLGSDGFADQFGQDTTGTGRQKKFSPKRLRETLSEIAHLPMADQKAELLHRLRTHQGNLPQTDDILLLGVRL